MTYIIIDWMYNVCFESKLEDFKTLEDADEFLDRRIEEELAHDGLEAYEEEGDITKDFSDYRGEYSIEEYDEDRDRIICVGIRYVLKKDYYKG